MTALIFLDVDGVLNRCGAEPGSSLESVLIARLATLVSSSRDPCRIVLTSTWRCDVASLAVLRSALTLALEGVDPIISVTPSLKSLVPRYPVDAVHGTRNDEILLWMYVNVAPPGGFREGPLAYADLNLEALPMPSLAAPWRLVQRMESLASFVIIDDLPLASHGCIGPYLASCQNRIVHVDSATGLSECNCAEAKAILEKKTEAIDMSALWRRAFCDVCPNPRCCVTGGGAAKKAAGGYGGGGCGGGGSRSAWTARSAGGEGARVSDSEEATLDGDWVGDAGDSIDEEEAEEEIPVAAELEARAEVMKEQATLVRGVMEEAFGGATALLARLRAEREAEDGSDEEGELY